MTVEKILLVDDEAAFVDTMIKWMRKKGFTIYPAYSGLGALEQLETHPEIDVVILDVKMPVINGLDVLSCIKKKHPFIEVILLSGQVTVETAMEQTQGGAFDFLMKPCDPDLLVSKIKEAAIRKRQHEKKIQEAGKGLHLN